MKRGGGGGGGPKPKFKTLNVLSFTLLQWYLLYHIIHDFYI